MAAKKKERTQTLVSKVCHGPGAEDMIAAVQDLMRENAVSPLLPTFGSSFRQYPIRFTGIKIYYDGYSLRYDIEGVLDYRRFKKGRNLDDQKVRIIGYDATYRIAKSFDRIVE